MGVGQGSNEDDLTVSLAEIVKASATLQVLCYCLTAALLWLYKSTGSLPLKVLYICTSKASKLSMCI
jgi:hypothetical protein